MKKKSLLKGLILSVLLSVLLVGCSTNDESVDAGTSSNKDEAPKDLLAQIKEKDKIVFGVKMDTRLFGLKNTGTGEVEGLDIDIAKSLAKEILGDENKVEFVEVNTKTRIPLLENGDVDAVIATMVITEERKKVVDFTEAYFKGGQSLLVKKGSDIKGIEDLDGKKVITVKGATSGDLIRKEVPGAQVLEFDTYFDAFSALKSEQGDTLTTDDAILYGMADEDPNYVLVGGTLTDDSYGIAIKKGNENFVAELNKGLKKMQDSGEYDEIFNKWIKR